MEMKDADLYTSEDNSSDEDEEEYVPERIIAVMFNEEEGRIEFKVRWEGYPEPEELTWEPLDNLKSKPMMIDPVQVVIDFMVDNPEKMHQARQDERKYLDDNKRRRKRRDSDSQSSSRDISPELPSTSSATKFKHGLSSLARKDKSRSNSPMYFREKKLTQTKRDRPSTSDHSISTTVPPKRIAHVKKTTSDHTSKARSAAHAKVGDSNTTSGGGGVSSHSAKAAVRTSIYKSVVRPHFDHSVKSKRKLHTTKDRLSSSIQPVDVNTATAKSSKTKQSDQPTKKRDRSPKKSDVNNQQKRVREVVDKDDHVPTAQVQRKHSSSQSKPSKSVKINTTVAAPTVVPVVRAIPDEDHAAVAALVDAGPPDILFNAGSSLIKMNKWTPENTRDMNNKLHSAYRSLTDTMDETTQWNVDIREMMRKNCSRYVVSPGDVSDVYVEMDLDPDLQKECTSFHLSQVDQYFETPLSSYLYALHYNEKFYHFAMAGEVEKCKIVFNEAKEKQTAIDLFEDLSDGFTLLHLLCSKKCDPLKVKDGVMLHEYCQLIEFVLENVQSPFKLVNSCSNSKVTPLMIAASIDDGSVRRLQYLLRKGSRINVLDAYYKTALIYAIEHNCLANVTTLLYCGADYNSPSKLTAQMICARLYGEDHQLRLLIDKFDKKVMTPLFMEALQKSDFNIQPVKSILPLHMIRVRDHAVDSYILEFDYLGEETSTTPDAQNQDSGNEFILLFVFTGMIAKQQLWKTPTPVNKVTLNSGKDLIPLFITKDPKDQDKYAPVVLPLYPLNIGKNRLEIEFRDYGTSEVCVVFQPWIADVDFDEPSSSSDDKTVSNKENAD